MARVTKKKVKKTATARPAKKRAPAKRRASAPKKVRRPAARKKAAAQKMRKAVTGVPSSYEKVGEVSHYFPHVNAAAIKIAKKSIKVGDEIYLKGHTTDFKETITSIQLDHAPIQEGKKGQEIGLLVKSRVRIGDTVYKLRQ